MIKVVGTFFVEGIFCPFYVLEDGVVKEPYVFDDGVFRWMNSTRYTAQISYTIGGNIIYTVNYDDEQIGRFYCASI